MSKKGPAILGAIFLLLTIVHVLLRLHIYMVNAHNQVEIPESVFYGGLVMLIISVVFALLSLVIIFFVKKDILKNRFTLIAGLVAGILAISTVPFAYTQMQELSDYRIFSSKDYISRENLRGYDVDEIETHIAKSSGTWAVLIGRSDCGGCQNFVAAIEPYLEEHNYVLPTCYIDVQVSAGKRDAMEDFLKSNNIERVPVVLYVKDGKIVDAIAKPASNLNRVETILDEMYKAS
ncbi:MAG: hypothetical protein IJV62_02755 [Eggerthellaceae bacterium]|nr:hypothetical protein [Eggerthellaceae bacterium]